MLVHCGHSRRRWTYLGLSSRAALGKLGAVPRRGRWWPHVQAIYWVKWELNLLSLNALRVLGTFHRAISSIVSGEHVTRLSLVLKIYAGKRFLVALNNSDSIKKKSEPCPTPCDRQATGYGNVLPLSETSCCLHFTYVTPRISRVRSAFWPIILRLSSKMGGVALTPLHRKIKCRYP